MDRYRGKTLTFLSMLANALGVKQRPLSKSLGPPGPQTCHILEFPDELILSILSHVSPDPGLAGPFARFHFLYNMYHRDYHQRRLKILLPLSMTCRAMRLRLLPWIWERIEVLLAGWEGGKNLVRRPEAIVDALCVDQGLAMRVKFLTMHLLWKESTVPLFVKFLESLPNLHTLEIMWADPRVTGPLEKALKHIELPQIKTLIMHPATHPLLRHCHGVEDFVCVPRHKNANVPSDSILSSLASNRDSKVKRLAIPLDSWANPSRFVALCPKLTELTAICPVPDIAEVTETGYLLDPVGSVRSATSELVNACKALPDFDTFQIVHGCGAGYSEGLFIMRQRQRELREHVGCAKDSAIDCLKDPETGRREREERRKTTVRVIELLTGSANSVFYMDSVRVEEYEV